jgi:hypothetical protein
MLNVETGPLFVTVVVVRVCGEGGGASVRGAHAAMTRAIRIMVRRIVISIEGARDGAADRSLGLL